MSWRCVTRLRLLVFVRFTYCMSVRLYVHSSHHEQLQQQHQQKQQALGRWEFWVVVMSRPTRVPLRAEVSLRPPPTASSTPRSAGIGPVYCTETEICCDLSSNAAVEHCVLHSWSYFTKTSTHHQQNASKHIHRHNQQQPWKWMFWLSGKVNLSHHLLSQSSVDGSITGFKIAVKLCPPEHGNNTKEICLPENTEEAWAAQLQWNERG